MMKYETPEKYKQLHHEMRIARVKKTIVWMISAGLKGERDGRFLWTDLCNKSGWKSSQPDSIKVNRMIIVDIRSLILFKTNLMLARLIKETVYHDESFNK